MSDFAWLEVLPHDDNYIPAQYRNDANTALVGADIVPLSQINNRWLILAGLFHTGLSPAERRHYVRGAPLRRQGVRHGPLLVTFEDALQVAIERPLLIVIQDQMDWAWALLENLQAVMIHTRQCGVFKLRFWTETDGTARAECTIRLIDWNRLDAEIAP